MRCEDLGLNGSNLLGEIGFGGLQSNYLKGILKCCSLFMGEKDRGGNPTAYDEFHI